MAATPSRVASERESVPHQNQSRTPCSNLHALRMSQSPRDPRDERDDLSRGYRRAIYPLI